MSRIDEALRRAARETSADATVDDAVPESPLAGVDIETLAREPFPIETERPPRLPVTASPAVPTRSPAPDQPTVIEPAISFTESGRVEEEPDRPLPNAGRLFDRVDGRLAEKVVADDNMAPASREQYRRLAAVLHDAQANSGLRVLMIASALPGEGKTLTATNLALTLSESYRNRVLLIDADLRRPTLHQVFRLATATGLIEGLEAKDDVKLVVRQVSARLSVLPAGRPTTDPMAALTSTRMRRLVDEAKEAFDWVILDTPPLTLLPDAHLLSGLIDGAVLVVRANSTPHELVKRAADMIGRQRITGVVLNQAEAKVQPGYGDYSHGYYLAERESLPRP